MFLIYMQGGSFRMVTVKISFLKKCPKYFANC